MDYVTPGYQGLSWAILLKAIEDGCSKEWLFDIVSYYAIDLDPALLERIPANKIKINSATNEMIAIHCSNKKAKRNSLLSMQDGLHVAGLANVAPGKPK